MNAETLERIGLTRGESEVYLTLLKLGNTTTGDIIKQSKVSRSKVYDVLERLKQKGLATEVIKENIKYFEATDPNRILDYLELKKTEIEKSIDESKPIISSLNKLKSANIEKQEAKVYIGPEGWATVFKEIISDLTPKDEYLIFGINAEEFKDETTELLKRFHRWREDKGIVARLILHENSRNAMKSFPKIKCNKIRYTQLNYPVNMGIWKNNVLTLDRVPKPVAYVIKSRQIADKYKEYFEYLWKRSKE